jgi:hypothetical protein
MVELEHQLLWVQLDLFMVVVVLEDIKMEIIEQVVLVQQVW